MIQPRQRMLYATLTVNAVSSGLCGAGLFVGAAPLATVLGLPGPLPLLVFGALLLAFALQVWRARRDPLDLGRARLILYMDVAYVVASFVLVLGWPGALSPVGRLLTALVADLVGVFAVFEYVGLRRARAAESGAEA